MTLENKPRLDIVSGLIDQHLEHIAGDILSNLSQIDIANAVAANPKWSNIATSRTRLKKLLARSNEKTATLKAFYMREELHARQTQSPCDIDSLFLRACIKCSNLSKSHLAFRKDRKRANLLLTRPFGFSTDALITRIYISNEFIALVGGVGSQEERETFEDMGHFVQLYDRWTFQFVNTFTMKCAGLHLHFIEHGIYSVLITYHVKDETVFSLWSPTTAMEHSVPIKARAMSSFCVANLFGIVFRLDEGLAATVYKVDPDAGKKFDCLVENEFLGPFLFGWHVPESQDLDCFAICLIEHLSDEFASSNPDYTVFQLRSKRDFTLLKVVSSLDCLTPVGKNSFLLDDCFVFDYAGGSSVYVVSPIDGKNFRVVYKFCAQEEMERSVERSWTTVEVVGRFLVLYSGYCGFHAVIWKLPSDFIETCRRHLEEGTVGVTSHCDQEIIDDESILDANRFEFHYSIDQYGIVKNCIDNKMPTAVYTTVLNSIISDGDD